MADRRGFIGRLLTFCGVAAVAPAMSLPEGPKRDEFPVLKRFTSAVPDLFSYKGFTVWWTGWKACENMDVEVCQWCACEGPRGYAPNYDRLLLYASYPGDEGRYYPGAIFDISIKKGQEVPNGKSTEEEKFQYRLLCLQRLMKLIDERVEVGLVSGFPRKMVGRGRG
jgi:hypothetical protein